MVFMHETRLHSQLWFSLYSFMACTQSLGHINAETEFSFFGPGKSQ